MIFDPVKFVAGPFRHIAAWSNFNEVQQHLLKHFDRRRLVVRKGEADGGNVEVAHEALFRTWKRLGSWLEPERARLEALRSLQVDAGNWDVTPRTRASSSIVRAGWPRQAV